MKVKVTIEEVISQTFEIDISNVDTMYEELREKYVKEAKGVFNNVIALKEGQIIDIPVTQKEEHEKI